MMRTVYSAILVCAIALASDARASVTVYTSTSEWQSATGAFSAISFTELPAFTWINEQYSYLGVHFTDGSDQISVNSSYTDGQGLNGALDSTTLKFDQPMTAIGTDFLGT